MLCFIVHELVKALNEHIMTADTLLGLFVDKEAVHGIVIPLLRNVNEISFLSVSEDINVNLVLLFNLIIVFVRDWELNTSVIQFFMYSRSAFLIL